MGAAHRDLKLQNFLLDANYDLRLIDYGMAGPIAGRNIPGLLTTWKGTPEYMAPEIHANQPYEGVRVDVFALGVTLFTLMCGTYPFKLAKSNDDSFKYLAKGNPDAFWKSHIINLGEEKKKEITEDFKSLINGML
jgi:serine/threonine protein kinase